jgi:hypothetical protein
MENYMINIQETADKYAVVEALYRFAAGLDLRDNNLLASAFSADAISDFRPAGKKAGFEYPVLEGRDTIVAALLGSLSKIDLAFDKQPEGRYRWRQSIDGRFGRSTAFAGKQPLSSLPHEKQI